VFALLSGLLTGFSLIIAIGAQNAFLIRQGLTRKYSWTVITIASLGDALLISLGTLGLGALVTHIPWFLEVVRWVGVAYLLWFAFTAFRKAFASEQLAVTLSESGTRKQVVLTLLALTFLNPHVYIDTVLLLGSIGSQFGDNRWWFAAGAITANTIWFTSTVLASRVAARMMSRPIFWRILDLSIGVVMLAIVATLALYRFAG
jgi:L-lysine exporter family protein LysE/ArgO